MIYLDHAATTPPEGAVIEAMDDCMRRIWANPSAAYSAAGEARRQLRLARQALSDMLNADAGGVVFTSGGTEANNQAVALARGGHAVVSAIEHASVLNAARALCREVSLVPPGPDGVIAPEAVEAALKSDTRLISVQLANNETGAIQRAGEIGALARARRVPFHCDAVQAFGHIPIDMDALKIDLLTLSAHKLYGPRGAGALVVRSGVCVPPLLHGGGQELGLRSGTENVPAVCGLRVACELARSDMAERAERETALMALLLDGLRRALPGCRVLSEGVPRLPAVAAVLLPGLSAEAAIARLDLMGIQISGGAACATREGAVSHVYRAMGLSDADARCVIRLSPGRHTRREEIEQTLSALATLRRPLP